MSRDLTLLHPKLQMLLPKIKAACAEQGLNVLFTDGMRTKAEQDALYEQGRTVVGTIVTNVQYPNSMHNWGVAVDFCRNVRGKEYDDSDNFFAKVGSIAKAYGLEWGGDWKNFPDKPHLQLAEYSLDGTTSYLRRVYGSPEKFMAVWTASVAPSQSAAADSSPAGGAKTWFSDVPKDAWYEEALAWAVENGIIAGFEDGTFRPNEPLTRAQIVSVLYRYDAYKKGQKAGE